MPFEVMVEPRSAWVQLSGEEPSLWQRYSDGALCALPMRHHPPRDIVAKDVEDCSMSTPSRAGAGCGSLWSEVYAR